jgi:hypothetical protein
MLTTGNTADITVAQKLISQIDFKGSTILADRAYGKCEFREFITNHGARHIGTVLCAHLFLYT